MRQGEHENETRQKEATCRLSESAMTCADFRKKTWSEARPSEKVRTSARAERRRCAGKSRDAQTNNVRFVTVLLSVRSPGTGKRKATIHRPPSSRRRPRQRGGGAIFLEDGSRSEIENRASPTTSPRSCSNERTNERTKVRLSETRGHETSVRQREERWANEQKQSRLFC